MFRFLSWTADRGLSRRLTVPAIPGQQPADFPGDDQRWQFLQRCLTDTPMPVGVRAAGALVLLFGLQLQRIRHLTAGQITEKDGNACLTAGRSGYSPCGSVGAPGAQSWLASPVVRLSW